MLRFFTLNKKKNANSQLNKSHFDILKTISQWTHYYSNINIACKCKSRLMLSTLDKHIMPYFPIFASYSIVVAAFDLSPQEKVVNFRVRVESCRPVDDHAEHNRLRLCWLLIVFEFLLTERLDFVSLYISSDSYQYILIDKIIT